MEPIMKKTSSVTRSPFHENVLILTLSIEKPSTLTSKNSAGNSFMLYFSVRKKVVYQKLTGLYGMTHRIFSV